MLTLPDKKGTNISVMENVRMSTGAAPHALSLVVLLHINGNDCFRCDAKGGSLRKRTTNLVLSDHRLCRVIADAMIQVMKLDRRERKNMLWTIIILLLIFWALGFIAHVAGWLIHILLIVAVIVLAIKLVKKL
jgi:hypothetical protein